jgi:hypothetical protein
MLNSSPTHFVRGARESDKEYLMELKPGPISHQAK